MPPDKAIHRDSQCPLVVVATLHGVELAIVVATLHEVELVIIAVAIVRRAMDPKLRPAAKAARFDGKCRASSGGR